MTINCVTGTIKSKCICRSLQSYLQDTRGTSAGTIQQVASAFPAFAIPPSLKSARKSNYFVKFPNNEDISPDLGFYAIKGYMAGDDAKAFGRYCTTYCG